MKKRDWLLTANLLTIFVLVLITMQLFEPHQWALNALVNLLLAVLVVYAFRKLDALLERKSTR